MRKTLSLLLVFATLCSFCLTAATAQAAAPKLNKKKLSLSKGSSFQLKVKNSSAPVKWTSSKKKVASVSKKGKVKAKAVGAATITAKTGGKKLRCKVTVRKKTSASGTKANPKSAYTTTTFNYYEEGKKRGRFSIKLLRFVSGDEAAAMAKTNSENLIPERTQEYIYFKFRICYLSGSQTVNAKDIFNYYYNIFGDNSTRQMRNLDWGFFFEPIDDLGTTVLSPGNKVTCGKAILINKGYDPITFRIQTGKDSYTWFTTEQ